jgi:stage IV sporulation protein FB
MPRNPLQELVIAIAGPAVNFLLLALFAFLPLTYGGWVPQLLGVLNLGMGLFNLIPAFPMDGGRVLRAALASRLGYVRATEIAATIGQWVAFGLGFLGLFGNPLLIFIAIFVYLAAASEAQLVAVRAMSRGVPVRAAMMTQFATLPPDATIDHAVETLLRTSQNEFPVVDGAGKPAGVLGRNELIKSLKQRGPDALVADAMTAPLASVSHRACLDEAFRVLQEKSAPAVGIVDADGRLVGLVTSETIAEMLMVRDALPSGVRLGPWSRPAGA